MIFIILLIIILFLLLLYDIFKKDKFKNTKYKDTIIFTSGPSLNEIKNHLHIFTPKFYDKYNIVGIKDSAIFLDKLGIKVDYFLFSHAGYKKEYDTYKFKNSKVIKNCGLLYSENSFINFFYSIYNNIFLKNCNKVYINTDFNNNIIMNCVTNDNKNCFDTINKNSKKIIKDGHIVCDQGIPLAIKLKSKNIYCLGWDICGNSVGQNDYNYFNKEKFTNNKINIFNKKKDIFKFENIREFTKYLPKYLKQYYNINIYKLSDKQCVNLPLFNINNL